MFHFLFSPLLQNSLKQGIVLDKQGADETLNSSGKCITISLNCGACLCGYVYMYMQHVYKFIRKCYTVNREKVYRFSSHTVKTCIYVLIY